MMDLDQLQSVRDRERQTDKLQQLRESFYEDAADLVAELREERDRAAAETEDPFDDPRVGRLSDQINTAEQTVEAIYEKRVGKLVKAASFAAADLPAETEGMTAEEQDLFDALVADIRSNRQRVLKVLAGESGSEAATDDVAASAAGEAGVDGVDAASVMGGGDETEPPAPPEPDEGVFPETDVNEDAEMVDSARPGRPPAEEEGTVDEAGDGTVDEAGDGTVDEAGTGTVDEAGTGTVDEAGTGTVDEAGTGTVDEAGTGTVDEAGTGTADEAGDGSRDTPDAAGEESPDDTGSGSDLTDDSAGDDPADSAGSRAGDVEGREHDTGAGAPSDVERTTVRITADVGEIFGVDEREYHLEADQIVTLPSANAEPLLEQEAAERVDR